MNALTASSRSVGGFAAGAAAMAALFCAGFSMLEGLATGSGRGWSPEAGLQLYWIGGAGAWMALTGLAWCLARRAATHGGDRDARGTGWIVLGVAVLLRLWIVDTTTPQLSDDLHRYVFDGRNLAAAVNPYRAAPLPCAGCDAATHRLVQRINHPEMVTIYLPVSQLAFGALGAFTDADRDPFGYFGFRLGFVAVEMVMLCLVMRWLTRAGRSLWWAALYAWHPLALSEVAGSGHQDVLGILPLVACLAQLSAPAPPRVARCLAAGALFALCAAVKPMAVPLVVPILWRLRHARGCVSAFLGAACLAAALVTAPFLLMDGGLGGLWDSGGRFVRDWSHNASFHALLAPALGHRGASWASVAALAAVVVILTRRRVDLCHAALVCLFAEVLLSSTAHPWYLLWALTLLPLRFNAALWMLTWTVMWSYAAWLEAIPWHLPAWLLAAIYAPVYALLVGQGALALRRRDPAAVPGCQRT